MTQVERVLDASAVLALILNEDGARAVEDRLSGAVLSVVNAAEVGDRLFRQGASRADIASRLEDLEINVLAAGLDRALSAAALFVPTRRAGLSMGDRFCLSLAQEFGVAALTGDRRWLDVADAVGVKIELFR